MSCDKNKDHTLFAFLYLDELYFYDGLRVNYM